MTRNGIICGGSICIDVNKVIDRLPPPEHVATIVAETPDSGGPGFNMPVNLVRLGAGFPLDLVGVVGEDEHGRLAQDICARHGIGTSGLAVLAGQRTAYTDVMIEQTTGRRTFFYLPGVNALLSPAHFDLSTTRAKIFHFGAPGVHERMDRPTAHGNGFSEVLAQAKELGLRTNMELVCVEAERIRTLTTPCLPFLDSIVINELEAAAVTGIDVMDGKVADPERVVTAGRALLRMGVRDLVVIHFPAGGIAVARTGQVWRQASVRVPPAEIKSTNGAGDAFASGIVLGLHEGWPIERALRLAVCVAAVSLRSYSTSGGILPAAECLAYGEAAGFRTL